MEASQCSWTSSEPTTDALEPLILMLGTKIDFDVVRKIALVLPGVEDSTIHGARSLKVRGKLLTCPALHKTAEPGFVGGSTRF